jgi:hypothetical protein
VTHLEKHPEALLSSAPVKVWAPVFWGELEEIVSKIPCGTCKKGGLEFLQAERDRIAIEHDKKPYDPKNFLKIAREFEVATRKCHAAGYCSTDTKPFRHPAGTLPHGFTACESKHPEVLKKISKCVAEVKAKGENVNPFAVCRASIPCPPHN